MSMFLKVRKYGGRVLLSGMVIVAVSTVFWFRHVQRAKEEGPAPPSSPLIESQAQMITRDFKHVETRMDRTIWVLEAAVAEIFHQKARLMRVKITFYGNSDEPVVITGRHALVDMENWDAELFGDVRAVGSDGSVLKTRKLEWSNGRQILRAPWPVQIRNKRGVMTGRQAVAKVDEKWFKILGRVSTTFHPPEGFLEPSS